MLYHRFSHLFSSKEVGNVKTSELRMTFTMMKGGGSCNNT